jgi:hypothetical protein
MRIRICRLPVGASRRGSAENFGAGRAPRKLEALCRRPPLNTSMNASEMSVAVLHQEMAGQPDAVNRLGQPPPDLEVNHCQRNWNARAR